MRKEIAITVKPTLSCNMRCKHCFNGDDLNNSGVISVEKVHKLVETGCKEYKHVKMTFHGGEPSLAGYDFYKSVFEHQHEMNKKYGTLFYNNFTTNGLALNNKMMELLIENNVLINISFDGPYNNLLRQQGDKVYNNIKKLQEKEARLRIFCTLSKESAPHLKEIYEWFKDRNLSFKTIPIEKRGYAKEDRDLIMDTKVLVDTLVEVYKYWIKDKDCKIRYYTFEEFASLRWSMPFKSYWFNRKVALNPDGRIYPFGRPNDVNFCLGEADEVESIEECFSSKEYERLMNILREYRKNICKNCKSLSVCNGVAVSMSYMYVDNEELIRYSCNQSSEIFNSILKVNDQIIEDFKNGRVDEYNDTIKKKFAQFKNCGGI